MLAITIALSYLSKKIFAIVATTKDYIFNTITVRNLDNSSYKVYILEEPQKIRDRSELDQKKYGFLVKSDTGKSSLLLPDLKELNTTKKNKGSL